MMLATFDSSGTRASRSGTPTTSFVPSTSTSNSTICTSPPAKTSVWRAAGIPTRPATAFAASSSDETMKSISSSRSRQISRYSTFVVRTIVCTCGASFFANIEETTLISSRDVHAIRRPQSAMPASRRTRRLAPFPATVTTSKRYESAWSRATSRSSTVTSCSSWSASTTATPTCPAPTTKIFIARA